MERKVTYAEYERQLPDYLILRKEGCFYMAYNRSAEVLAFEMNYQLGKDMYNRAVTGGPDIMKIMSVLNAEDYNYVVVENNKIVDGHSGRSPFTKK